MEFQGILSALPPCEFAFAYGSGVFEQKGYENAKSAPMVDLVLATQDSNRWHAENLRTNSHHYSTLSAFGPSLIAHIQDNYGAGLYYNTLVPIPAAAHPAPNQKMKYGVMSLHALLDDLLHWRTMYISGRMHKPVRIIHCTHDTVLQAARENLRSALRAALLMLPASFTAEQLFTTIAGLSYTGDFRMVFGENPNKVSNIVSKNMQHFHTLYDPVISASFPTMMVEQVGDTVRYTQDLSPEATLALGMALPFHLQQRMAAAYFARGEVGKTGFYASLVSRFRPQRGGEAGERVPVTTLRDFLRIQSAQRPGRGTLPDDVSSPLMKAAADAGFKMPTEADSTAQTATSRRWLESTWRTPGGRAIAYAEAGRQVMQRLRNQRLQFLIAKRDRRAERQRNDVEGNAQARITKDTMTHLLESDSQLATRNYSLAAQTPQIVAFWDEILKADPHTPLNVYPVFGARRGPRFGAAPVLKIAHDNLRPAISHIVGSHARSQSIKGIVTAGPVKATIYAFQKLEKFFKATLSKVK